MNWTEVPGRVLGLVKTISDLELEFKRQSEEITLLRKENSEIRKEMAAMAERLARLEEARKTTAAEVKLALGETLMQLKMEAVLKENEELKRRQITPSAPDSAP